MTNEIKQELNAISAGQHDFDIKETYEALLEKGYTKQAALMRQRGMNRRTFLKLAGASLAMTGVGLSGCVTTDPPDGEIIPYVITPEEIIPGRPLFFATTMTLGGVASGLLIETHEGRPTRIEGNPKHPATMGSADILQQASIMELYNPDRSIFVRNQSGLQNWSLFLEALAAADVSADGGTGLRILTETVSSPTLAAQMEDLLTQYPNAKWYQYDPISQDNAIAGSQLAFGEVVNTVYNFENADVVLSIDGDFFENLSYAREFMAKRQVRGDSTTMNRLYAIENTPGLIGAAADHRLALRPSDIEAFVRALAVELGVAGVAEAIARNWNPVWFNAVVADLQANEGRGIVLAGRGQSPAVHALVHAINIQLGNAGETVIYAPPALANPVAESEQIVELATEMQNGDVNALFILGGNPAYNAPVDVNFADALAQVSFSVHLSLYVDETSELCTWHVPATHYIEEWSDARAFDGTASLVQPPIGPLYDTVRSTHQMVALLLNDERTGYDILRGHWESQYSGSDFEGFWRKALHDGVVADSTPDPIQPTLVGDLGEQIGEVAAVSSLGLEIVYRADPAMWDGRFAQNSYLQELPHPLTKISWDTAAYISHDTADELGVSNGDLVNMVLNNNIVVMPVWIMEGHANNTVTVSLGFGRGNGEDVEAGYAFNGYLIRSSDAMWTDSGVEVTSTGNSYELVTIRGEMEVVKGEVEPIHHGTLDSYLQNPEGIHGKDVKTVSLLTDYEYESYAWGMSIDLTSCIGCNSCLIACQMENNIPTVGKDAVGRQREMYWIRLDRYYIEEENGDVSTTFQPVPCMQCENAPCEQVCPVHATVHGPEGLNQMIYNRCVGTRYCAANCPYSVRRFNFFDYVDDAPIMEEWRNPDVSVRPEGVMEKCTYCVQRINAARIEARKDDRRIQDGEAMPACAVACPTQAIIFGDTNDPDSRVTQAKAEPLDYGLLAKLNTQPRTTYMARLSNPNEALLRSESGE